MSIERRHVLTLLGGAAAAWPLAARAQSSTKVWRIGVLETTPIALNVANFEAFRQGLRELGYVEGRNLIIEYRSAEGRAERFAELAADLLRLNVDVIVARGTPAALALREAVTTTPVVMAAMGEPLMLVSSLAHPAGNLTGLSSYAIDLGAKRAEFLKELVPDVVRIAALLNMGNSALQAEWKELQTAAPKLGIDVALLDIRKLEDIAPAFDKASASRIGGVLVEIDALTQENRALITKLAAEHRLPAIYAGREFIDAGGLIAYGVNYPDLYRRAARYVDKIFMARPLLISQSSSPPDSRPSSISRRPGRSASMFHRRCLHLPTRSSNSGAAGNCCFARFRRMGSGALCSADRVGKTCPGLRAGIARHRCPRWQAVPPRFCPP
jgi:putative tryptophan/tyrosine transport system substrate-binding protein